MAGQSETVASTQRARNVRPAEKCNVILEPQWLLCCLAPRKLAGSRGRVLAEAVKRQRRQAAQVALSPAPLPRSLPEPGPCQSQARDCEPQGCKDRGHHTSGHGGVPGSDLSQHKGPERQELTSPSQIRPYVHTPGGCLPSSQPRIPVSQTGGSGESRREASRTWGIQLSSTCTAPHTALPSPPRPARMVLQTRDCRRFAQLAQQGLNPRPAALPGPAREAQWAGAAAVPQGGGRSASPWPSLAPSLGPKQDAPVETPRRSPGASTGGSRPGLWCEGEERGPAWAWLSGQAAQVTKDVVPPYPARLPICPPAISLSWEESCAPCHLLLVCTQP